MKKVFHLLIIFIVLVGHSYIFLPSKTFAQLKSANPKTNVKPGETVDVEIKIVGGQTQVKSSADIVLVMDTTGSMGIMFGTDTKIAAAKKALKAFVDESSVNVDQIGLVGYDAQAACVPPDYDSCARLVYPMSNMTDSNKDAIKNAIDSLIPGSSTSIGSGLDKAKKELSNQVEPSSTARKGVPKYIVIATDGIQNTYPSPYDDNIFNSVKNSNIQIFSIGIGDDVKVLGSTTCTSGCPTMPPDNIYTSGELIMKDIACRTDPDCNTSVSFLDTDTSTNDLGTPFDYFYADNTSELVNFYKKIFQLISRKNAYQLLDTINKEIFETIVPGTIKITDCAGNPWPSDDIIALETDGASSIYVVIKNVDIDQNACVAFKAKVHDVSDVVVCNGISMTFAKCIKNKADFDVDGNPRIIGSWDPDEDEATCIEDDGYLTGSEITKCLNEMPSGSKPIDPGDIHMDTSGPVPIGIIDAYVKYIDGSGNCLSLNPGVAGATIRLERSGVLVSQHDTDSNGSIPTYSSLLTGDYILSALNFPPGSGVVKQVITGKPLTSPVISTPPTFQFTLNPNSTTWEAVFCIGSSKPWYQTDFGDVRYPEIINPIPIGFDKFGSTGGISGEFPGVYYSSGHIGSYGSGEVSPQGWKVDDEYDYTGKTGSKNGTFSYSFFKTKAKQDGVSIKLITSSMNLNSALLNSNYTAGIEGEIFEFDGNVTVNAPIQIPSNKRVVILVKGGLEIKRNIVVDPGGLLVIAATEDITITKNVGVDPDSSDVSLQGFYSSEKRINIMGDNCSGGVPDKRLNVEGALISNSRKPFANGIGFKINNTRNLCVENNANYPYLFVKSRLNFLTLMTDFYKTTYTKWEEEQP